MQTQSKFSVSVVMQEKRCIVAWFFQVQQLDGKQCIKCELIFHASHIDHQTSAVALCDLV